VPHPPRNDELRAPSTAPAKQAASDLEAGEHAGSSAALQFTLNGQAHSAPGPLRLDALLERVGLAERRVAVAINASVIPRSRYAEARIQDGDRIEIIHAVGGG